MVSFKTKYRGREVEFPSKQLERAARRLSPRNLERVAQYAEQEMRRYLTRVSDAMHRRHSRPWQRGGVSRKTLSRRSGRGLQSIKNFIVRRTSDDIEGTMRLNKYMTMHEHGGWIRAKNSTYLTIPLDPALNDDGTPKKKRARDWKDTFVIKSRRGNLIIVQKRGRRIVPLYVLKKRVRIKARLGLRKEMKKQRPELRRNVLNRIHELVMGQLRR